MACRFATWPTRRSPDLVKATTEGVVRPPSSLGITFGSPPSITATTELVVPRSIPIIFAMVLLLLNECLAWLASHLSELLSIYLMQEIEAAIQNGKSLKRNWLSSTHKREKGFSRAALHPVSHVRYLK